MRQGLSRMAEALVLSVAIGNSAAKLALVDPAAMRVTARAVLPAGSTREQSAASLAGLMRGLEPGILARACVCSVVPASTERIQDLLAGMGIRDVGVVDGSAPLPIELDYDTPRSLGADRIAAACWCSRRFAAMSCAIIGAGTAMTVDYLERGSVFRGGAILPGPALQLASLHRATARLPDVGMSVAPAGTLPGRCAADGMSRGVATGLAGACERIVEIYRGLAGGVDRVVAHGGAWPLLAPLVRLEVSEEPDAVLLGAVVAGDPRGRGA